jgi:hypothetical protein
MRLKKKPVPPPRALETKERYVSDFGTLSSAVEWFESRCVNIDDVKIDCGYGGTYFKWKKEEDDRSYSLKVDKYKRQLKEYEEWYQENKEAVNQEIELRKKKDEEKKLAKIKKLEKELEELRS